MAMSPKTRKLALTAHVTVSVGWMGAVAAFLALSIVGLNSPDVQTVRSAYSAMNLIGWSVIVPLGVLSMPTGLIMSFGTEWRLFRHYWVVGKFIITLIATALLLLHMQPVGHLARVVSETTLASGELAGLRIQMVADAVGAMVALMAATALSVYKPRGVVGGGRSGLASRWITPRKMVLAAAVLFVVVFIVKHLAVRLR